MKKLLFIVIGIIVVGIVAFLIFWLSHTPKSLDDMIEFDMPNNWKLDSNEYYNDDTKKKIVIVKNYSNDKDEGYFTVSIFSYKRYDVLSHTYDKYGLENYIGNLTHRKDIIIDGKKFYTGMTSQDDYKDMISRAYVRHNAYVIDFRMNNSDEAVTDEQKEVFNNIIKSVKFIDKK